MMKAIRFLIPKAKQAKILCLSSLLAFSLASFAQLSGTVTNARTGKPLEGVEVFINQSSLYAQSSAQGGFSLPMPPPGFVEVCMYKNGFSLYRASMRIVPGRAYTLNLSLTPHKGKRKNPTPLEHQYPLTGYRTFSYGMGADAAVRFEPLPTDSLEQAMAWEKKRKEIYTGSLRHLLKALATGTAREEGFTIKVPGHEADNSSFLKATSENGYFRLDPDSPLEVGFETASGERLASVLALSRPLDFSDQGIPLDGSLLQVTGAMAAKSLERIPIDFVPIEGEVDEVYAETLKRFYEKVYVHTDKPYYYPGEPMWFKAYLNYYYPSWRDSLSKVLYVELIGPQMKILQEKALRIDNGYAIGNFFLPDSLTRGDYFLRAYTSLQRNFGDENLYFKHIPLLGITDKVDPTQGLWQPVPGQVSIKADKEKYATRQKVTLTIEVKDSEGNPLAAGLSVAVTDAGQVTPIDARGIEGLVINGTSLVAPKKLNYSLEQGITIRGRYLNAQGKPEKTILSLAQWETNNLAFADTDKAGYFEVGGLVFYDSANFFYKAGDGRQPAGQVELAPREKPPFLPTLPPTPLALTSTQSPQRIISQYEVPTDVRVLEEVVIEDRKIETVQHLSTYGRPDAVIEEKNIKTAYGNLLYSLVGVVPGLMVEPTPSGGRVIFIRGAGLSALNQRSALVLLNDVPLVGDPGTNLALIDPSTVERIEITKRINVLYGSLGANGVISVFTKQGVKPDPIKLPEKFLADGYFKPHTFQMPDYGDTATDHSTTDYRSTLYWDPQVVTDAETGTATISFYAADLQTTYRVEVEGMAAGKPLRGVCFIEVGN